MNESGLDGAKLAQLSGVSPSEVYNILKNRRGHSGLRTLQKLLDPMGKTLSDVFCRLDEEKERNFLRIEKEPAFVMEFKKQGYTVFSDTPPRPDLFVGKISFFAGAKGFSSGGLEQNCLVFLRVVKGNLLAESGGKIHALATYQKLIMNGRFKFCVRSKSSTETAEALIVTVPNFWSLAPA